MSDLPLLGKRPAKGVIDVRQDVHICTFGPPGPGRWLGAAGPYRCAARWIGPSRSSSVQGTGGAGCATVARARFCRRRRRSRRPLAGARCRPGTPSIAGRVPARYRAAGVVLDGLGARCADRPSSATLSRVLGDEASAAPASSPTARGVLEQLHRKPHRAGIGSGSRGWLRTGHGRQQHHGQMNHDTVTVRCDRMRILERADQVPDRTESGTVMCELSVPTWRFPTCCYVLWTVGVALDRPQSGFDHLFGLSLLSQPELPRAAAYSFPWPRLWRSRGHRKVCS